MRIISVPSPGSLALATFSRWERVFHKVSWNRTGWPAGVLASSPSRITTLPRMMVPTGQPVTVMPSNGDQPHFEASQSVVISRAAFRSTRVKSASKPRAMRPLPAMP